MKSDTINALPVYPNTWNGTCSSYENLSSDELTYSVRQFKFRWRFPVFSGNYQVYHEEWCVNPNGVPVSMLGAFTVNYAANVSNGTSPEYGPLNQPSAYGCGQGTVQILNVTFTCLP